MESKTPSIIDLDAELAKLTLFRGRTPQSTVADRKGSAGRGEKIEFDVDDPRMVEREPA
jgi:hypothetical protein